MTPMHTEVSDEIRSTAALYSAGALPAAEARTFEEHITDCAVCRAEAEAFGEAADLLAGSVEPVAPPPSLRERLLGRVAKPEPDSGLHVKRANEGKWRATPFPGVTFKLLHLDRETMMMTTLLRMEPGAFYPKHHHEALEQCLVVEGDVRQDDVIMSQGDYSLFEANRDHSRITTERGCVLLLISSAKDEVLE
ncbi:MAG: cupin domain-containing protein [Bryobacterales bacterium]|nr:cupin domain-containing protein [Bryobacterales bacterium]